jgi:hypothetical protein
MKFAVVTSLLVLLLGIELAQYANQKDLEKGVQSLTTTVCTLQQNNEYDPGEVALLHGMVFASEEILTLSEEVKFLNAEMTTIGDNIDKRPTCTHDEIIEVYTCAPDILYLQGNRIYSESGDVDWTYRSRNMAVQALGEITANQSQEAYERFEEYSRVDEQLTQ